MGHKTNGQTAPLDARIASTLASAEVNKTALTTLLAEAEQALVAAQETITTETANALDIANSDPDASDELVKKAERTTARLQKAVPKLRDRIRSIEAYEHAQAWHARADVLRAERDRLAEELAELYEPFIAHLANLYARIDDNAAAIHQLHGSAPRNENRRLLDAEMVARGLENPDARHPRLRDNLKLPAFIRASEIAYPPDPMDQWNQHAAQMNEAYRQRMVEKFGLSHSPDWAAARDLQIEQAEAEFAKRDAELKAKETADKAAFEQRLQEAERRRLGGTP